MKESKPLRPGIVRVADSVGRRRVSKGVLLYFVADEHSDSGR